MNKEDQPITADDIDHSIVESKHHPQIRNMLRRLEIMWNSRLGNSKVIEHAIDLKEDSKPFKTALYWSGPAVGQLELFEFKNQLDSGAIEPGYPNGQPSSSLFHKGNENQGTQKIKRYSFQWTAR